MSELAAIPQPNDRPRKRRVVRYDPNDRLERLGPMAVKDIELLGYAIGNEERAALILADYPKESLVDMDLGQITRLGRIAHEGQDPHRGLRVRTARTAQGLGRPARRLGPGDALSYVMDIKDQQREHFKTLFLNARNQIVHAELTSIGSLSSAIVHPREVFQWAVQYHAASVILAHNHPSGDVSPSQDDINLTRRLVQAGEILGIDVLDHLIVGADDFISLKERGLI